MFLDLFTTLFKKHVVSKSCKGVFLFLIFKLNFHPFQCNFDFFNKKFKKNLLSILTMFLNFENCFCIQDVRAKRSAGARTSPHLVYLAKLLCKRYIPELRVSKLSGLTQSFAPCSFYRRGLPHLTGGHLPQGLPI